MGTRHKRICRACRITRAHRQGRRDCPCQYQDSWPIIRPVVGSVSLGQGCPMRRMFSGPTKWLTIGLMLVLGGLGPITWLKRADLFAWYCVHQLASADEAHRDVWIGRLLSVDDVALPRLIDCLCRDDVRACTNAQAALLRLVERADEIGRVSLAGQ